MKSWLDQLKAVRGDVFGVAEDLVSQAETEVKGYVDGAQSAKEQLSRTSSVISDLAVEKITEASESKTVKKIKKHSKRAASNVTDLANSVRTSMNNPVSEKLSEEQKLRKAIDSLSGKDRVGLFGEGASAIIGALGGAAASGAIASAAGATTFLSSSALGTALGGVLVTSTPVGWVVGSALVLGAAGYGAAKLVRSGSEQDKERAKIIQSLQARLDTLIQKDQSRGQGTSLEGLKQIAAVCIAGGIIDQQQVDRMLFLIEEGKLDIQIATKRLEALAFSNGLIERIDCG